MSKDEEKRKAWKDRMLAKAYGCGASKLAEALESDNELLVSTAHYAPVNIFGNLKVEDIPTIKYPNVDTKWNTPNPIPHPLVYDHKQAEYLNYVGGLYENAGNISLPAPKPNGFIVHVDIPINSVNIFRSIAESNWVLSDMLSKIYDDATPDMPPIIEDVFPINIPAPDLTEFTIPEGCEIDLERAPECNHSPITKQLFTSSYTVCEKCGLDLDEKGVSK